MWDWTAGMIGNSLLLGDYCLLAVANLGFDASLCCHPRHKAMVYPRFGRARHACMYQNHPGIVTPSEQTSFQHTYIQSTTGARPPAAYACETEPWASWG